MKKYVYILLLLASVSTLATAQIKIGSYTFKDGGEYTGELKGRKPNGKGKTIYKNGNTYEGEYIKGKREGNGTYTFHDGEKYVGQWFQDRQQRQRENELIRSHFLSRTWTLFQKCGF